MTLHSCKNSARFGSLLTWWKCDFTQSTNLSEVIPSVHGWQVSRSQWTAYTANISAHFLSFSCLCPCIFHVCCTYCTPFARGQAVSYCFPVISDLPSEIEHCKIVQVNDFWDSNRTFRRDILYALKYFLLCLSTAIKLKNRDRVTSARAEIQSIIWTNQINKMNETRKKQQMFMLLGKHKSKMVKIFQISSFCYVF